MELRLFQIILLLAVSVHRVKLTIPCTTPEGLTGSCVSLHFCPRLRAINNLPRRTITLYQYLLFTNSKCPVQRSTRQNLFCCPKRHSILLPMKPVRCYTSAGRHGICSRLNSCPTLTQKLNEPVTYNNLAQIENIRCGGYDQYSVCCNSATTNEHDIDPRSTIKEECSLSVLPPSPASHCCGFQNADDDRIVGGSVTSIDQYPWLVLIEYEMASTKSIELACGGSLLSSRYVLTAAHCVRGTVLDTAKPVNVRLGEYDISNPGPDCIETPGGGEDCTEGPTVISIEEIIVHEAYDPDDKSRNHDIALIRLSEMAPYSDFIRPICLPTSDVTSEDPSELTLYTSGWGFVENKFGIRSNVKLDVDLPYKQRSVCQKLFGSINVTISEVHLCAGGERGKDACKGDSGGPLMEKSGRRFHVVGVVSFGPKPCGQENIPSVYTNVYNHLDWIHGQIRP